MANWDGVDWVAFNPPVIEEFRATKGQPGGRWAGNPMILLTTTGARSGRELISPLTYHVDGSGVAGGVVVIASAAGAPKSPAWYHNLVAHPDVVVELGEERFPARAEVAAGPERARLFEDRVALMPRFGEYRLKTSRAIPVVVLRRAG